MVERRKQRRVIDQDLAVVKWQTGETCFMQLARVKELRARQLDIAVGKPLPPMTDLEISFGDSQLNGRVRQVERQGFEHLLAVELEAK